MIRLLLNRDVIETSLPPGTVMLDFLRRGRGLAGTKEGCREGDCGACMVLLGEPRGDGVLYRPVNSCLLPLGEAQGRHVVSIEGLNLAGLSPAQHAFVEENATQCGFCTPGFIVSLAGFLLSSPSWDVDAAVDALAGNICRCTGYASIRRALQGVCAALGQPPAPGSAERTLQLIAAGWLPESFKDAPGHVRTPSAQADSTGNADELLVAGGTDLFVQRAETLVEAGFALLSRRDDLRGVRVEGGCCVMGAATPWADLEDSPVLREILPGLAEHLKLAASRPIRHRATPGGNLVNASPIGDLAIMLLALGASVVLENGTTRREVALRDFFPGYKKLAKTSGELVAEVRFPVPPPGAVFAFEKVSRRAHLDIASVNSAMLAVVRDGTVAGMELSAGGVAPVPLRLGRASARLAGAPLNAAVLREALDIAQTEVAPISDVRGSADYKRLLLRRLLAAHFLKLAPGLAEELLA
jgi:xanthine dehydrogenase small subunit